MICIIVITSFYLFIFDCFDTSFDIKVLYNIVYQCLIELVFLQGTMTLVSFTPLT